MTPDHQTKRRWLQSVLDSVDETIPTREFPREVLQEIQPRQVTRTFAMRLKMATRAAAAAH